LGSLVGDCFPQEKDSGARAAENFSFFAACSCDPKRVWNAGVKGATGLKAERNENGFSGRNVDDSGNEQCERQLLHDSSFLKL
jgi:hypothetical protein